jgi:putative two-component system response regulator
MTTNRPYRKAMRPEEATDILRSHAGSMFDPDVVDVFLRLANPAAAAPAEEVSADLAALSRELSQPHHEPIAFGS